MKEFLKQLLNKKSVAWSATVVWMIVIFLFSAQSHSGAITEAYLGDANVPIRKLAHITEFFILCVLFNWSFMLSMKKPSQQDWHWRLAFASTVLYAISDEWHQSYVPGRSAGVNDVMVDLIGVFLALIVFFVWRKTSAAVACSRKVSE